MDEQVCTWCECETVDGSIVGWEEGEYGWKCPECRIELADELPGQTVGLAGFEAALNGEKE